MGTTVMEPPAAVKQEREQRKETYPLSSFYCLKAIFLIAACALLAMAFSAAKGFKTLTERNLVAASAAIVLAFAGMLYAMIGLAYLADYLVSYPPVKALVFIVLCLCLAGWVKKWFAFDASRL